MPNNESAAALGAPATDKSTYSNPVYDKPAPDPFVLKWRGEYWCYSSGIIDDGNAFAVRHSRDLVNWNDVGSALSLLPGDASCYWAPEVIFVNGRFYLYYSVGNETLMHIRVAVADRPEGPFVDSGHRLTDADFAIDAHIYIDGTGTWYLFYATDFLDYSHIGTGTVCDRMVDPFTLLGQPHPVTRALFDWQVYDPQRAEKGGVRWHTIEGSFVLAHKGRLYHMFSGGNWQNISYGVSYSIGTSPEDREEWTQVADGLKVFPILRTVPGQVIGPGHNCVVRGPNNRQLYCVYHRWPVDHSARQLAIDPLDWAGERMLVLGPSTTPQPVPLAPTFASRPDGSLGRPWRLAGAWRSDGHAAIADGTQVEPAVAALPTGSASFLVEATLQHLDGGPAGLALFGADAATAVPPLPRFRAVVDKHALHVTLPNEQGTAPTADTVTMPLGDDWNSEADHLLRVEVDGRVVGLTVDDVVAHWRGQLPEPPAGLELFAAGRTAFRGVAVTFGWEAQFTGSTDELWLRGWYSADRGWAIVDQQLVFGGSGTSTIYKGPLLDQYELVVNARAGTAPDDVYAIYPCATPDDPGIQLQLQHDADGWFFGLSAKGRHQQFRCPPAFDPAVYQQFRLRKAHGRLAINWEQTPLGEVDVPTQPTLVGLGATGSNTAFDLVRVTAASQPADDTGLP